MDIALQHSPGLGALDVIVDASAGDLVREETLATAVTLSLLCDRTAQPHEVPAGGDRRGWWADAFAAINRTDAASGPDAFGSRLWLLMREKQTPETQQRLRAYVREALQWLVDDALALSVDVTVFVPRIGWYVADVELQLRADNRRFRFEWNGEAQLWRLAGETH